MTIPEDRDEFKKWFNEKPWSWGVAIAARVTMRATPLVQLIRGELEEELEALYFLEMWRSTLNLSIMAISESHKIKDLNQSDDNHISIDVSQIYDESGAFNRIDHEIGFIKSNMNNFNFDDDFWEDISYDFDFLLSGNKVIDLLNISIWKDNKNPKWSQEIWRELKNYFLKLPEEHWHVWTDWWEERRDGKPFNIEMEREIVLIPDEDWQKGPAHVNLMIAEIRAKYRLPRENSRGLPFGARDGAIVLRNGRIPSTDEDAALFHAALSDDATRLAERLANCGKNEDPYDILCISTDALIVALGSDATETKTSKLWLGARKLREIERIDRRTQNEFGRNEPPLDTEVGEALRTTLATFTAFCGTVPALQKLEQANRDNAEVTGIPLEAIDPIIAMVRAENDKFHDEVRAAFDGLLADARSTIDGVAERGEAVTLASVENLIHRLVAEAIAEDRKGQSGPFWEAYKKKAGEHAADLTLGTLSFSAKAVIALYFADLAGITDKLPNGENARHMLEQAIKGTSK